MVLEDIDFQSQVHQQVTLLIESWKAGGMEEETVHDNANQFFNMGLISSQQVQQEGGVTPEGTDQLIEFDETTARRVVDYFMKGLNLALLKAEEEGIPSQEKWQILQNVAFHVYEQSKQVVVATLGQENTPEVQISDDQIMGWLGQTAVEAMMYYLGEMEKQNGPLQRVGEPDSLLNMSEDLLPQPIEEPIPEPVAEQYESTPEPEVTPEPITEEFESTPEPEPIAAQAAPAPPAPVDERLHKFAAVGMFLSTLSAPRQATILSSFKPDEQVLINQYRDPDLVVRELDLAIVAKYMRRLKDKMGGVKTKRKSSHRKLIANDIANLPPQRLEKLFQAERPLVRGYVSQLVRPGDHDQDPYQLPPGVEESLRMYIQRNFPRELAHK